MVGRTWLAGALFVASCSARHGSPQRASSEANDPKPTETLVVFAPVRSSAVTAKQVVLGSSATVIGQVDRVDARGSYESEIRIGLRATTALHADASALVCDNVIRLDNGSAGPPDMQDRVIPLAHTTIKPESC